MGLKLRTQRSRVTCNTNWASQAPPFVTSLGLSFLIYKMKTWGQDKNPFLFEKFKLTSIGYLNLENWPRVLFLLKVGLKKDLEGRIWIEEEYCWAKVGGMSNEKLYSREEGLGVGIEPQWNEASEGWPGYLQVHQAGSIWKCQKEPRKLWVNWSTYN